MVTYVCKISNHCTTSFNGVPCSVLCIHRNKVGMNLVKQKEKETKPKSQQWVLNQRENSNKKGKVQKFTTIQCMNFLDSLSSLKASKAETHGVKNPYPTPTRTLPAMLRPNHKPNKAGKPAKIATLSGASNLLVL